MKLVYSSKLDYCPWQMRIDPIHEITWANTVMSRWEYPSTKRHVLDVDATGHLHHNVVREVSPLRMSDKEMYSPEVIIAMALLTEWNQLTTLQVSALLNIPAYLAEKTMWKIYSAGMVYRLTPDWWYIEDGDDTVTSGSGHVWRLNRRSWTTERWFDSLGNLEWALVTNGMDPLQVAAGSNAPTSLRHNLATVETCIKAMEICPGVVGAWGDHHSRSEIMYDVSRIRSDKIRNNIGDGIIVTRDGKVIVLESAGTTSSMSTKDRSNILISKAAAWVSIAGRTDIDLRVLFLDISPQPRPARIRKFINIGIEKESPRYVSSRRIRERGQERIHVVDSRNWFPVARMVSEDFLNLRVWHPASQSEVDLAPVSESGETDTSDVIVNTLASLHTPAWIHRIPS